MKRPNELTCTADAYGHRILYRGRVVASVGQQRNSLIRQSQMIEQTKLNHLTASNIIKRLQSGAADALYHERIAEIDRNSTN